MNPFNFTGRLQIARPRRFVCLATLIGSGLILAALSGCGGYNSSMTRYPTTPGPVTGGNPTYPGTMPGTMPGTGMAHGRIGGIGRGIGR
jgi:hypothetical protein